MVVHKYSCCGPEENLTGRHNQTMYIQAPVGPTWEEPGLPIGALYLAY